MEKKTQKPYLKSDNLLTGARFMTSSISYLLLIILLKEFIKLNVNMNTMIKKFETCGIKHKYCNCFLEYTNFKDKLIE